MPAIFRLPSLREALVSIAASLATFGCAVGIEHYAHQTVGVVLMPVALSLSLFRTHRERGLRRRLLALLLLPVLGIAAAELGRLMLTRPNVGDAAFVAGIAGSIWLRRFGPDASKLGTLAVLPLITLLVVPAPVGLRADHLLWLAAAVLVAYAWVTAFQLLADRAGFLRLPAPASSVRRTTTTPPGRRLAPSDRMALQMGAALASAFVIGRAWYSQHWSWIVLTAFIVCSGARGRGDVAYKSVLRLAGAAVGTVAATLLARTTGVHQPASIAIVFAILFVGTWLRGASYAYWAAAMTAVVALLRSYFGETGTSLLLTRLEEIGLGALCGVAASWLLLPLRTTDVVRRRLADALAVLTDLLRTPATASWQEFDHTVGELNLVAPSVIAARRLTRRRRRGTHPADWIDTLNGCHHHLAVAAGVDEPKRRAMSGHVIEARRALGRGDAHAIQVNLSGLYELARNTSANA